jgi:acyl-CoA thioesterase-1
MKKYCMGPLSAVLTLGAIWLLFNCGCTRKKNETPIQPEQPIPSQPARHDSRPVIVAFGDSLTAGRGVDPERNYPSQLQNKIDKADYRYRVVNAGVSGETSAQGLDRLQSVIDLHPSIVIVELGANDGLRGLPAAATQRNLAAIVRGLQDAGSRVVLAGMQVPPNYGPQYASAFQKIFKDLAKEFKIPLIPFFLEGVGGRANLNQDDGIHPTAEGYKIVVDNVWKVLQPLL